MALLKAELIETMEQNLDDAIWDRELREGAKVDPWMLEMAKAIFPGHDEIEYQRAVLSVTEGWGDGRESEWKTNETKYGTEFARHASCVLRLGAVR